MKVTKPMEMLASKKPSLVQQLWFDRAKKILAALDHLDQLVEFFAFCFSLSGRLASYLGQTTGNKYEVRSFLELYSTWTPPDYDPFSLQAAQQVGLLVEKFENEGLAIEARFISSQQQDGSSGEGKRPPH